MQRQKLLSRPRSRLIRRLGQRKPRERKLFETGNPYPKLLARLISLALLPPRHLHRAWQEKTLKRQGFKSDYLPAANLTRQPFPAMPVSLTDISFGQYHCRSIHHFLYKPSAKLQNSWAANCTRLMWTLLLWHNISQGTCSVIFLWWICSIFLQESFRSPRLREIIERARADPFRCKWLCVCHLLLRKLKNQIGTYCHALSSIVILNHVK